MIKLLILNRKILFYKHPPALWLLSISQLFYCIAIGSLTSILILYLIYAVKIPPEKAYTIFASMNSLIYILPLGGGAIGDRIGYINAAIVGFIIVLGGFILLSLSSSNLILFGLTLFVVGNALIIPNTNALVGLNYPVNSIMRNSAYTLYFLIYNIGFLISPVLAGYESMRHNKTVFIISSLSIIISFVVFVFCFRHLKSLQANIIKNENIIRRLAISFLLSIFILFSAYLLMRHGLVTYGCLFIMVLFGLGLPLGMTYKQSKLARLKILFFLILCIISIAFWSLYMLVPSFLTVFIAENVNRSVMGWLIPPSCYYALDAFFVITIGLLFSKLWNYVASKGKEIALPTKFAFSLLAVGIAYLLLSCSTLFSFSHASLINPLWIIVAYAFIAIGELLISPIALAMVGCLMPVGREGIGMGIWQIFIGISAIISGFISKNITFSDGRTLKASNEIYHLAFMKMSFFTILIAVTVFLASPLILKITKK